MSFLAEGSLESIRRVGEPKWFLDGLRIFMLFGLHATLKCLQPTSYAVVIMTRQILFARVEL